MEERKGFLGLRRAQCGMLRFSHLSCWCHGSDHGVSHSSLTPALLQQCHYIKQACHTDLCKRTLPLAGTAQLHPRLSSCFGLRRVGGKPTPSPEYISAKVFKKIAHTPTHCSNGTLFSCGRWTNTDIQRGKRVACTSPRWLGGTQIL